MIKKIKNYIKHTIRKMRDLHEIRKFVRSYESSEGIDWSNPEGKSDDWDELVELQQTDHDTLTAIIDISRAHRDHYLELQSWHKKKWYKRRPLSCRHLLLARYAQAIWGWQRTHTRGIPTTIHCIRFDCLHFFDEEPENLKWHGRKYAIPENRKGDLLVCRICAKSVLMKRDKSFAHDFCIECELNDNIFMTPKMINTNKQDIDPILCDMAIKKSEAEAKEHFGKEDYVEIEIKNQEKIKLLNEIKTRALAMNEMAKEFMNEKL